MGMKDKVKTKGTHSNVDQKKPAPSNHEDFKLGEGYGSGEKQSDYQEHPSQKQYGDNPNPKSGGGYTKAGAAQPREEQNSPKPEIRK